MNRIIRTVFTVLICLAVMICGAGNAFAASVGLSGSSSVKEGDSFTVTVSVSGETVTSGSIEVSVSSSLEIVSGNWALSGGFGSFDSSHRGAYAFQQGAKTLSGSYFVINMRAKSVDPAAKVSVRIQLKNDGESVWSGSSSKTISIICKNHSYGDWVKTEATCTKSGSKTRTCSVCGTADTQSIPALGHDVKSYSITKEPTCTETGTEAGKCSRCGESVSRSVAALGHTFGEWAVTTEPTCTEPGVETRKCIRCEEQETRETELAPHEYGEDFTVIQEATLTREEIVEARCIHCDAPFQQATVCRFIDGENGVTIECRSGTFTEGSTAKTSVIVPGEEERQTVYKDLEDISGLSRIIDVETVNNGVAVEPDGIVTLTLRIPEEFSHNVAVGVINEDGSIEIAGTEVIETESGREARVETKKLGKMALIDLSVVPASKLGVSPVWKYAAFGEVGVIFLLILLLILKRKKKDKDKEKDKS